MAMNPPGEGVINNGSCREEKDGSPVPAGPQSDLDLDGLPSYRGSEGRRGCRASEKNQIGIRGRRTNSSGEREVLVKRSSVSFHEGTI